MNARRIGADRKPGLGFVPGQPMANGPVRCVVQYVPDALYFCFYANSDIPKVPATRASRLLADRLINPYRGGVSGDHPHPVSRLPYHVVNIPSD